MSIDVARVALTHAERVVFPDAALTKHDIALYYARVAERMLPHLVGRPVTFVRCPEGIGGDCFYQKHPGGLRLRAIDVFELEERSKSDTYMRIDDVTALVEAVQYGVVELHVWGSRVDDLERPDRIVFDLDPGPGVGFDAVRQAAGEIRERLGREELRTFVMTTGGAGLHVVVPLHAGADFDAARRFAKSVANAMTEAEPNRYVAVATRGKRERRVFIDYLRNGRGATAICPYSLRRQPRAPVAMPVRWDELSRLDDARAYRRANVFRRLAQLQEDPWAGYFDVRQRI